MWAKGVKSRERERPDGTIPASEGEIMNIADVLFINKVNGRFLKGKGSQGFRKNVLFAGDIS